jgi:hypothetical protein
MAADTVVTTTLPSAASCEVKPPSVLRCGLMLLALKLALKLRGFGPTIRWIGRRVRLVPQRAVEPATVPAAERAVATAAAFYPGRALCLEQSLVLYYVLRRQGVAVKYCHGIRPHPFEAHAWIEYGGEVINDVPEHLKPFARLPEQLP